MKMGQILRIVARLRSLGEQLPAEKRPAFLPGAPEDAIAALEECLPAPLPPDFTRFLRACGGIQAMDIWNGYWIGGVPELTRSIKRYDYPSTVEENNGATPVLPIATDGGGNAFLMSLSDETIWKWDHETGNVTAVADDFGDFLQHVIEDWEYYLANDDAWDYLSG